MPPLPFETDNTCTSLRAVLEVATSFSVTDGRMLTSNYSFPPSKKQRLSPSSRRQLKNTIKAITARQANQAHEMNRMIIIAMSRTPSDENDDDTTNDYNYSSLQKPKLPKESSLTDLMSSPVGSVDLLSIMGKFSSPDDKQPQTFRKEVSSLPEFSNTPHSQDGLSTYQQSPPLPPSRRASFISSEDGDVSLPDLIAATNPEPITSTKSSPETTPETYRLQLQPRYSSPWLSKLGPRSINKPEAISPGVVTPNNDQVSARKAESSNPRKSIDAGISRSSSKGALIRNRFASMSKLASSLSSTSLSKNPKRLNKSFSSVSRSKVNSVAQVQENQPVANATWDATCVTSAKSPRSSKINTQGHHASMGSLQSIIASATELIKTSSLDANGSAGQACISSSEGVFNQALSSSSPLKLKGAHKNSPGGECNMMRLNKSLGSLSLRKNGVSPDREGCPGTNAVWDKTFSKNPAVGRKSSLGNLRKKQKVLPAGAVSPSSNAEWGAL